MNSLENQAVPQIRLAVPEEAASIASILARSFAAYQSLYTPEAFAATTPTFDQIRQRWNEGPVWVAVHHNNLVGTVAAVPQCDALYIRSLAVLPIARGQRIGHLLLQHVECLAREGHYQRLFLSTTPFLHHAIRLYEQFGFERSEEGPDTLFGTPLITMVKTLRPGANCPATDAR